MEIPKVDVPSMPGVDSIRENTRRWIAYFALGGFIVITATIIVAGWVVGNRTDTKDILAATGSMLSGVVGAIVGFYFRSETNNHS